MLWGALLLLLIVVPCAALWGCASTIVPPANVEQPVTVYVFDYGRHSSLVLPAGDAYSGDSNSDALVEFAYGEWKYFAKGHRNAPGAMRALLISSEGTLGRRTLAARAPETLIQHHALAALHQFDVEKQAAHDLRDELNEAWHKYEDTAIYNEQFGLHFVQYPESYHFLNNCNPMLARWLQSLDCKVRGAALFSNWRVKAPAADG